MARRGVFKIINLRTGKVYIGSSNTNMDNLIYSYWQKLYSGNHHNYELQEDFNYYGRSNFSVEVVDICYSEREVRSLRDHEIYINRHNTYNEDVPVHYGGGNHGASFGGNHGPQNNIINDLIGIIDKSNLHNSYKDELNLSVISGKITSKSELNTQINHYKYKSQLMDILENSNLKDIDKHTIKFQINNGEIPDRVRLDKEIKFYQNAYKLIDIVMNSDIKSSNKNTIIKDIKKGKITSLTELDEEIEVYKTLSKYDKHTIKKLAEQYCSYSIYNKWSQERDKIFFKSNNSSKTVHLDSIQKETDLLKQKILNSLIANSKFNVEELADLIMEILNFNSYELKSKDVLIFNNKYKLDLKTMEKLYYELDLTKDNKFKINESIINTFLKNRITTENFNKTLESSIIEYCEIKHIAFWELINQNYVLLYEDNLNLISIDEIIKFLDSLYAEFNLKLKPLHLKNIYYFISRASNRSGDKERDSVERLLNSLSKSNLPVDKKINLKKEINKGKIYNESSLNDKINNLMKLKSKTSRRKIMRTSVNNDFGGNTQQNKAKKENKSKTGTSADALEKFYKIYGYQFCTSCGKKIPKFMDMCEECSKKKNNVNSKKVTKNPEEVLEKLNKIYGYQFCPSCGKRIPKFMDLCENCSRNQD